MSRYMLDGLVDKNNITHLVFSVSQYQQMSHWRCIKRQLICIIRLQ